jgi:hypothetical protein
MGYINHHETLETLATHLVHEDCAHADNCETEGGHCYDCTLAHLIKEFERRPTSISTTDVPVP